MRIEEVKSAKIGIEMSLNAGSQQAMAARLAKSGKLSKILILLTELLEYAMEELFQNGKFKNYSKWDPRRYFFIFRMYKFMKSWIKKLVNIWNG